MALQEHVQETPSDRLINMWKCGERTEAHVLYVVLKVPPIFETKNVKSDAANSSVRSSNAKEEEEVAHQEPEVHPEELRNVAQEIDVPEDLQRIVPQEVARQEAPEVQPEDHQILDQVMANPEEPPRDVALEVAGREEPDVRAENLQILDQEMPPAPQEEQNLEMNQENVPVADLHQQNGSTPNNVANTTPHSPTPSLCVPTPSPPVQSRSRSPIEKKRTRYDVGEAFSTAFTDGQSSSQAQNSQVFTIAVIENLPHPVGSPTSSSSHQQQILMSPGIAREADLAPTAVLLDSQENNSPARLVDSQNQFEGIQPVDVILTDSSTSPTLSGITLDLQEDNSSAQLVEDIQPVDDEKNNDSQKPSTSTEEDYVRENLEYFRAVKVTPIGKNRVVRTIVFKKEKIELGECQCEDGGNCSTSDCTNRASRYECPPSCRFLNCKNQPIAKGPKYRLRIIDAGLKGLGLQTLDVIPGGSFVIEYMGILRPGDQLKEFKSLYEKEGILHLYILSIGTYLIDATRRGNEARFINHHCQPNLSCQKWMVPGTSYPRVAFFAKRRIEAGEELFFNYQFNVTGKQHQCFCEAEKCKGVIGKYVDKDVDEIECLEEDSSSSTSPSSVEEEEPTTSRSGRAIVRPRRYR